MNTKKYIFTLLSILLLPVLQSEVHAQDKKAYELDVKVQIVDERGNPVNDAVLVASGGIYSYFANKDGVINASVKVRDVVVIEAEGYESQIFYPYKMALPDKVVLVKARYFEENDYLNISRPDQNVDYKHEAFVGAVSSIDAAEIIYPDLLLSNALQGKLPGLDVTMTSNGLGNNKAKFSIRGNHRNGENAPIVIIDGLERNLDDVLIEEIDKIEIMKDVSAKILYGPRAANGVVLVTTKKGTINKRILDVTVESGAMVAADAPEYLDSHDYAMLYNEALNNDGFPSRYSDEQLKGYLNSTGENDLFYPNVDFYDRFMKKTALYRKATLSLLDGNDRINYSLIAGYTGGSGFENIKDESDLNRLNLRGNLNVKVLDFMSAFVSSAVRYELKSRPKTATSVLFSAMSTTRPNEYPLTISPEALGMTPREDGVPYFGASLINRDNLLASLEYGGQFNEQYVTSQTDIGLDFDFEDYVEGLTARMMVAFDNYNFIEEGQVNVYPSYALRNSNPENPEFMQMTKLNLQTDLTRRDFSTKRTLGYNGNIGYARNLAKHAFGANLAYSYFYDEVAGGSQDIIDNNTTLRLNYGYFDKYYVEGILACMGSNRFAKQNRYNLSKSIGLSWVLSNENFLEHSTVVDFLKIKASYGELGYDGATDHLLYKTAWKNGDSYNFGEQNKTSNHTTQFVRVANEHLKWETSTEINVGIEGLMFDERLSFELNYFNELRDNIIGSVDASYSNILGNFVYVDNMGTVANSGIDLLVQWKDKISDFSYDVSANLLWSSNKILDWNQIPYPDKGTVAVGNPTDAIWGYVDRGLFGKDTPLAGAAQCLGHYQEGDIAYEDINADGIVDQRDKIMIGNTTPRVSIGIDLNLKYKNFGLYMLGVAKLGFQRITDESFYWIKGEDKYSTISMDRYHSENNPDGKYPRLTTTDGSNNFVNSTFWLQDASFFRLKTVELSYTFPKLGRVCKNLKLFLRGTNLFSIDAEEYLDPEIPGAGLTNFPLYRTFTGGLSIVL